MANQFDLLMDELRTMSAAAPNPGETAILYSGLGNNGLYNQQNAEIVKDQAPGQFYTIQDTQVGKFINSDADEALKSGDLTMAQFNELWNVASGMFTQEAQGNVCALIGISNADSTWYNYELPVILSGESGITSVNNLQVPNLSSLGQTGANAAVFGLTQCYEPNQKNLPDYQNTPVPANDNNTIEEDSGKIAATGGVVVTADNNASTGWASALGILAGAGLVIGGTLLAQPEAVAAGAALLIVKLGASDAHASESGAGTGQAYFNQSSQDASQALSLASEVAYAQLSAQVAAGMLPSSVLQSFGTSASHLASLQALLAGAVQPIVAQVSDGQGDPVTVAVQAAANGGVSISTVGSGAKAGTQSTTTITPSGSNQSLLVSVQDTGAGSIVAQATFDSSGALTGPSSSTFLNIPTDQITQNSDGSFTTTIDAIGDILTIAATGAATITTAVGQVVGIYNPGQLVSVTQSTSGDATIGVVTTPGSAGELSTLYRIGSGGSLTPVGVGFNDPVDNSSGSLSQIASAADSLQSSLNSQAGLDTPSAPPTDTTLSSITVVDLGAEQGLQLTTDPTGAVPGGLVISTSDADVIVPGINTDGLFSNSPGGIVSGDYRPGNQILSAPSQNLDDRLGDADSAQQLGVGSILDGNLADLTTDSSTFINIDPQVIGLNGNGIDLTNWINNNVYFQTNVTASGVSDGKEHHTSWVNPEDGILALDINGNGKIDDITEMLSEFFVLISAEN